MLSISWCTNSNKQYYILFWDDLNRVVFLLFTISIILIALNYKDTCCFLIKCHFLLIYFIAVAITVLVIDFVGLLMGHTVNQTVSYRE